MLIMLTAMLIVAAVLVLMLRRQKQRSRQRAEALTDYAFPATVRTAVSAAHPELSPAQLDDVCSALRDYFGLCQQCGERSLAMPSRVVDEAWHAFILTTGPYQHFCDTALGYFLHHVPEQLMAHDVAIDDALKRTWRLACTAEGIDPLAPDRLPRLFAIDARLQIADGFHFSLAEMEGPGFEGLLVRKIGCGGGCAGQPVYEV